MSTPFLKPDGNHTTSPVIQVGNCDRGPLIYTVTQRADTGNDLVRALLPENLSMGFLTRSDSNHPAQLQNLAGVLNFQISFRRPERTNA